MIAPSNMNFPISFDGGGSGRFREKCASPRRLGPLVAKLCVCIAAAAFVQLWPLQGYGQSFSACDFSLIADEAETEESNGTCDDCHQECAFRQVLLSSKGVITTAQTAKDQYAERFPLIGPDIESAKTEVGLGCALAKKPTSDPDRAAKLKDAAQNIITRILVVSEITIDGLDALAPDADADLLKNKTEASRRVARNSLAQVEEWADCPQAAPAPAPATPEAGPAADELPEASPQAPENAPEQ